MAANSRLIPLAGAYNFRDLGGYRGSQGRCTRWGVLFRSDTLQELTPDDVGILRSMGLATIIDLRTPRELDRTGRGPLEPEPIRFWHLPVIQEAAAGEPMAAPAPPGDDLAQRYLWYLEVGGRALLEALSLLSEPECVPAVFHCSAGKDRTGVLAALVLDILGVDSEVIVADYVITASRMDLIIDRARADPAFAPRLARLPASRFSVVADTMERFLGQLYEQFGGARAWALDAGLPDAALERMADLLLEPVT